jgi:hypothetical protein
MIKLLEPELMLKCRKDDVKLVTELMKDCENEYVEIMKKETDEDYKTKLILN